MTAASATMSETATTSESMNKTLDDLHGFISSITKPKFLDKDWAQAKSDASTELSARMDELRTYYQEKKTSLHDACSNSMLKLQKRLKEYSAELKENPSNTRLKALCEELSRDYEELLSNIKSAKITEIKAIHLKPVNYARNIFHVCCGLTCSMLYQFVLTRQLALILMGIFLGTFIILEITRRFSVRWNDFLVDTVFGVIARPHERHKTNGSTWYLIAMFLLVLFFAKPVVLIGVLILGFADPAASVTGKLWGRRKLFKDKSFVGTGAFLTVAFTVSTVFMLLAVPAFSVPYVLLVAAVTSLVATATELFSTRIDDNFSIPMMSALAACWFF